MRSFLAVLSCMGLLLFWAFPACSEPDAELLIREYEEKLAYNPYDAMLKRRLAVQYHNWAMEFSASGDWVNAIEKEQRAFELEPGETALRKALIYFYNSYSLELKDQKKYQRSVEVMEKARVLDPEDITLRKNAAMLYLDWAYAFFEKQEPDNAQRMLKHVADLDDTNPYLYVLNGEIAYARDNYAAAGEYWSRALELNPGLYDLRLRLEKLNKEKEQERGFSVREVGKFKLKFEGMEKSQIADKAADILNDAYRRVGQDLDTFPQVTVPVIIYPQSKLAELEYFPDWAAGSYDGKIRFGEDIAKSELMLQAVLFHEYTHVLVHHLAKDRVPLWLNEGLAEYAARDFKKAQSRKQRNMLLGQAVKNGTIFTLDKLAAMDLVKLSYLSARNIELVYAQSESFVTYLIERSSLPAVKRLLESLNSGDNVQRAVKNNLFTDLDTLEKDWKAQFE